MPNDRFRRPAYDYVKKREAGRTGRKLSRMEKVEKDFRTSFERDIRAEIERHDRALKGQKRRENTISEEPRLRRWWQFWEGRKPRTEGWD